MKQTFSKPKVDKGPININDIGCKSYPHCKHYDKEKTAQYNIKPGTFDYEISRL